MFFLQKQRYAISVSELLRLNDEKIKGLRTERKQYKEIFASTILNQEKILQAKHDEGKGREKKLETENKELKDENKCKCIKCMFCERNRHFIFDY